MHTQKIQTRFDQLVAQIAEVDKHIKPSTHERFIDQEAFMTWGMSCLSLLKQVFGTENEHYIQYKKHYDKFNGWLADEYVSCKAIFKSAYDDYSNGYIFDLRGLIAADLMDDGISQAEELLDAKHKDPACVVAGVCLETTLKELCDREGIEHNKLDRMNAELKKAGVYNTGMQKQITAWADRRNSAAHGQWDQYSVDDVKMMIDGIRNFIANYL